jgi:hypothetical protein
MLPNFCSSGIALMRRPACAGVMCSTAAVQCALQSRRSHLLSIAFLKEKAQRHRRARQSAARAASEEHPHE